jgi:hypothetical protein
MILIGSQALKLHGFDVIPKDFDFIANEWEFNWLADVLGTRVVHQKDTKRGKTLFVMGCGPVEFEIVKPGSSAELIYKRLGSQPSTLMDHHALAAWVDPNLAFTHNILKMHVVASVPLLYAIKMSHRYVKNSPHFRKTMEHIQSIRCFQNHVEIHPELKEFYKLRMKETYDYKHPKLNQSKGDFFADDGVGYIYDHDTIHMAVKTLGEVPAFELIKKDKADVFCSKEKFLEAPEDVKLATVLEESYVLALERCLIPNKFSIDPKKAFEIALSKVCTSIASGWWREFAWENYDSVMDLYDQSYTTKFLNALERGEITPYKKETAA